jgi:hypothetical protein
MRLRLFVRSLITSAVACCILGFTACAAKKDSREAATVPVTGKLFINNQPAVEARVTFVPTGKANDGFTPNPYARVEADGSFSLSTYRAKDGAPVGDYAVTVVWTKAESPGGRERGPDLLKGRYAKPQQSPLRVQVVDGKNDLEPFRLNADLQTTRASK